MFLMNSDLHIYVQGNDHSLSTNKITYCGTQSKGTGKTVVTLFLLHIQLQLISI